MATQLIGYRIAAVYEVQSAWLEPRLAGLGLSWNAFQLLSAVLGAGADASQVEVARRLGVTPATLSETVQSQVKKGLLSQVPSEKDRRVKRLELTDRSRSLMKRVVALVEQSEAIMARSIPAADLGMACAVLDRALANLEADLESPNEGETPHRSDVP